MLSTILNRLEKWHQQRPTTIEHATQSLEQTLKLFNFNLCSVSPPRYETSDYTNFSMECHPGPELLRSIVWREAKCSTHYGPYTIRQLKKTPEVPPHFLEIVPDTKALRYPENLPVVIVSKSTNNLRFVEINNPNQGKTTVQVPADHPLIQTIQAFVEKYTPLP